MRQRQTDFSNLYAIWGSSLNGGFTAIPNELLRAQSQLDVDSIDLNIMINLIRFWWVKDKLPFPSIEIMSEEIGINVNTIKKHLSSLEAKGLLSQIDRAHEETAYDLSGLVKKITNIREERF